MGSEKNYNLAHSMKLGDDVLCFFGMKILYMLKHCFHSCLSIGTLSGIYSQLLTGDETVRERCVKFLSKKVIPIDRNIIDRAAEDFMIIETKKVLQVRCVNFPLKIQRIGLSAREELNFRNFLNIYQF